MLEYVFAIVGFKLFRTFFNHYCDNIFMCWIYAFDWTFKANGGSGGWLTGMESELSYPCDNLLEIPNP